MKAAFLSLLSVRCYTLVVHRRYADFSSLSQQLSLVILCLTSIPIGNKRRNAKTTSNTESSELQASYAFGCVDFRPATEISCKKVKKDYYSRCDFGRRIFLNE